MEFVLKSHSFSSAEKFIQELAWRDHWQMRWMHLNIDKDIRQVQEPVSNRELSESIIDHHTGISAIDKAIDELYETGYMHNHMRMYVAALACNVARSHWKTPAKWMYFHLLDADWGSNALSWQWVAGTNSNKKYYANQENINKYFHTKQNNTFLDTSYNELVNMEVPDVLKNTSLPLLQTSLPESDHLEMDEGEKVFIYNFYNLDPQWRTSEEGVRILLLEPSIFEKYPICKRSIQFCLALSKNIAGIKVVTMEFEELRRKYPSAVFHYKEHPLNTYEGIEDQRDWMFDVQGDFSSFFKFWKQAKKSLK